MLKVFKQALTGAGDAFRRKPKDTSPQAQFTIKHATEAAKVLDQLLRPDPNLEDALKRSKHFFDKSPSQETLNVIFGHKPRPTFSKTDSLILMRENEPAHAGAGAAPVDGDTGGGEGGHAPEAGAQDPEEGIDPLSVTPLDNVFPSKRYSKEEIMVLRGVIGYTQQEHADHAARLGRNLYVQRREECGCDTTLVIAGQKIVGHRLVFAAFSAILSKIYGSSSPEQAELLTRDLANLELNRNALKRVFGWMYTGQIKIDKYATDIKQVAEKLSIEILLKELAHHTTVDDAGPPKIIDNPRIVQVVGPDHDTLVHGQAIVAQKSSSEWSFIGIEETPEQMATLVTEAARVIGERASAEHLIHKLEEEVEEQVEQAGDEGLQADITIPPILPRFEMDELYTALRNKELFLTYPAEKLYLLLSSDYIRVRSEFDVYEAAYKWFTHSFYPRKKYLQQIMSCPRWAYMTVQDMTRVRSLDTQFFRQKIVNRNVSRAKWFQDLLARGVTWNDYKLPPSRLL